MTRPDNVHELSREALIEMVKRDGEEIARLAAQVEQAARTIEALEGLEELRRELDEARRVVSPAYLDVRDLVARRLATVEERIARLRASVLADLKALPDSITPNAESERLHVQLDQLDALIR